VQSYTIKIQQFEGPFDLAATLMRIKAKLLLPRKEVDELGNEIDPREELTRRLHTHHSKVQLYHQ